MTTTTTNNNNSVSNKTKSINSNRSINNSSKCRTKIKNNNNNNGSNTSRKSITTGLKDGASNDKESVRKNELESLFVSSPLLASSLSSKPLSLQQQPTPPPPALPLLLVPQPTQTLDVVASEGKREETLVTETEVSQKTSRTSPLFSALANCPTNLQKHDTSLTEKQPLSTPPPPVVSVAVSSSNSPLHIPDVSTSDTRSSPPTTPPSLTPAFQLPSSGLLPAPVDQVSKPTPKARKSGTPANQSNHYVKTVNLAPIANIRIKLPVIENSYNSSPKSPPTSPLKINKVNSSKFDFPDKDEPLSLSDSENSRSKSIRPRKRRWGTYDLPNKKRKKIFKRNNENSGQDDMDDDDDDDEDDDDDVVSRDGEDLPEKTPSLEPVECDTKKTINNASAVIKNSSTILELLTKKSHTVATTKEENSGPIMPHLRRSRVPSQHRRSSTKSGHTGKTVAELLRESQAKQLAAKEFHNTTAAHQSAPYLLKEADRVIDITHKMDDCGKENSGSKLPELKKGLQNISPKTVVLGSKSNTVKNSTKHTPHWTHPYRGGKTHTHITRGRLIHTKGHSVTTPQVVIPLCCCKVNGVTFKKLPAVTYCQALDSIDGKVMGCCNKVTNSLLVRPAIKIPFMAVCEFHRQSLKQHQCCPGCGHFCMQGRFYQCRKQGGSTIHNFHKQCQLFLDNKSYCPHCGEESAQYEVMLTLNEPRIISTIEEKTVTQLEPSLPKSRVKLSIHLKTYKAQEKKLCKLASVEEGEKKVTFEPSASSSPTVFTSAGIPKGKDREILEKCFSILEQERPKKYRTLPKSLYNPCKEGDLAKVIYMLVDGADPNKRDPDNDDQTAVHAAAINGHLAILHVLIQAGGNIHIVDGRLNNAIIYACENNHLPIVKFLVQAGAQIDVKGEDGMTCLHMAAKGGYIDLMEFLLSTRKADVNVQDDGGWTPIIWAAEHRNVESAKFLVQRGADPTLKDNEENTGLHWAAFSGSVEIAELFLDYGCELESPNEHGDRPLHISVRQDNYECVVLCLLRGADISARNNINQLPSDCCLDQKSNVWMALNVNKELRDLASKRLERSEKLVHRDISFGRENFPINSINAIDDEGPPLDFQYVTQSVETTPLNINRVISSLQSCNCQDSCASMLCVCSRNSVQCWYDQMGRLVQEFNQLEPPYIFECNRNCRCWTTCNNRVVQNGIVCRLQLFKTKGRGWGVKTLRDIPQGVFICEYIGELISDSEADRREDDSYLFDLDNKDGETYCIDARRYGNISRFINHLCEPNVIPVKVFVDHQDMRFPRICFFASRDIKAGEEMGFDYGEKFWVIKWKQFTCACGSPKCKYSADTIRQTLEEYRLRHGEDDTPQES
ncbi:histone-lysine N-methyltransferase EHMT2 isoform X2 [Octopus sinensis]|uniref:Histone-lysine N-methyltransferase EHMT2 isoform X2 n=1 Tax=Octopus sinensis TaxID=2607531 RepID=A0A6P7TGR7_9MOLL|nr:histone-lysine N-methyltransferase EHMT2 isoform X2 [Octopus sinensis]